MNGTEIFPTEDQYNGFFQEFERLLPGKLPAGIDDIYFISGGPNWIVFKYPRSKYPQFTGAQYELHFSPKSGHHGEYFGRGFHKILAFYFGNNLDTADRAALHQAIKPYINPISRQTGLTLVDGPWGDNWAWIAANLTGRNLGIEPVEYADIAADFVASTFIPVLMAHKTFRG